MSDLVTSPEAQASHRPVDRRREFTHAAPGSIPIAREKPDMWRDMLFAATSVFMLSSIRSPVGRIPIFVGFAFLILLLSYRHLLRLKTVGRLFVLPLVLFFCFHLISAFRFHRNGLGFVLQAATVLIFVIAFVNRYSQVPMHRFLAICGVGYTVLFAVVVGYHLYHHHLVVYKFIADSKAIFDLLPIMLVALKISKTRLSRNWFFIALPIFTVFLLLSGERKAYILLILFCPLLVNFKSPISYILPIVLLAGLPFAANLEKSGYVTRQLGTLQHFAQGKVDKTLSNERRQNAIQAAWTIFQEHPADGAGTNMYEYEMYRHFGTAMGTHNEWMRVLAENGIIGFTFYSWAVLFGAVGLFRKRVWGRVRSKNEKIMAGCLFVTLVMYLSFEALDFIVLTAFALTPFVQFLWLEPDKVEGGRVAGPVLARPSLASRDVRRLHRGGEYIRT